jgi:hypothetical protein
LRVDTRHRIYKKMERAWRVCRAVCGGSEAVKGERVREEILPKLSGHRRNPRDYDTYVSNAYFFPGTARYREGLLGLLFQADPSVEVPPQMEAFMANVTGTDSPCTAEAFLEFVVAPEVVTSGRCGVLTDFPALDDLDGDAAGPRDLTVAQVEQRGILPVLTAYEAEKVINWREDEVDGRTRKTLVVLEEKKTVQDPDDKFVILEVPQWRVLELVPVDEDSYPLLPPESSPLQGGDGMAYHVEIWRRRDKGDGFEIVEEGFPIRAGRLLSKIPFEVVTPGNCRLGDETDDMKPPLMDLADVNVAHFRNSAIYEHGLLFTGSPQPYITGFDAAEELGIVEDERAAEEMDADYPSTRAMSLGETREWNLGSSEILLIKNDKAGVGVLVTSADDLGALREAMDKKIDEMVLVGGRILARDKLTAEAARTEEIRRQGERGVLAGIAGALSASAERYLRDAMEWMGVSGEVSVELNTDYATAMDPEAALVFSELRLRGDIGKSDLYELLRKGRVIAQSRTDEDIDADIRGNPPMSGAGPGSEPLPVEQ